MCFDGKMSIALAIIGFILGCWTWRRDKKLATGIFFFTIMETLQAVQYIFISNGLSMPLCDTTINKILTVIGWIHICCQPYFTHLMSEGSTLLQINKNNIRDLEDTKIMFRTIKRFCIIGGILLFIRWPMSYIQGFNNNETMKPIPNVLPSGSTEWLRGNELCTFKTQQMIHLGWSIPMTDPTYLMQSIGLHSFLMFAPFFVMYNIRGMFLRGIFLCASGPVLSTFITNNVMEQASIWCFISIAQICCMVFMVFIY